MKLFTLFFVALSVLVPASASAYIYPDRLEDAEAIVREAADDAGVGRPKVEGVETLAEEHFEVSLYPENMQSKEGYTWSVEIGEVVLTHDDSRIYILALHAACSKREGVLKKQRDKDEVVDADYRKIFGCVYLSLSKHRLPHIRSYILWQNEKSPLLKMGNENLYQALEDQFGKRPRGK